LSSNVSIGSPLGGFADGFGGIALRIPK
jgi:hypothetical protein